VLLLGERADLLLAHVDVQLTEHGLEYWHQVPLGSSGNDTSKSIAAFA
jgi:hypothetical protein